MRRLKFIQLQKDNEDHYRLLESLLIPYNRELDEHRNRQTDLNFIIRTAHGIQHMQGPYDRHLELCYDGDTLIGFMYGKVDHPEHKGFIKPGYGYIMEFYVKPEFRRKGYGKEIFQRLYNYFVMHGVKQMYLTADPVTGEPFWERMGFVNTSEKSPENGLFIYEAFVDKIKIALTLPSLLNIESATTDHAYFICTVYKQNMERLHGKAINISEWKEILSVKDPDERNFLIYKEAVPAAWLRVNGLLDDNISWISMLVVNDKN